MRVTEYAVQYTDGEMKIRNSAPEIDRIFPLADWIKSNQRNGGKVYTRTVEIVSDWKTVRKK